MTKKELEQLKSILSDQIVDISISLTTEELTKSIIFNLGVSECIEVVEQLISGERSLDEL